MMEIGKKDTEEISIEERIKSREIVQTILDYGVTQDQIKQMIYLLALEVEDPKIFRGVSSLISQNNNESSTILGGE